jgi:signal transduction histidine kinase
MSGLHQVKVIHKMMSSAHKLSVVSAPAHDLSRNDKEDDRRILIVHDDDVVRVTFASCLMGRYSCETARNAGEALELLTKETFALVIAGMSMPGTNGVELLREISKRCPDTMVIMASGIDRPQRVRDTLHLGAYDYLVKPCDLDVLELTVERALERRLLLREAQQSKKALEEHNIELLRRNSELEHLRLQMLNAKKMASHGQLAAAIAPELSATAGLICGNMEFLKESVAGLEELLSVYDHVILPAPLATDIDAIKEKIGYAQSHETLSSNLNDCSEGAERMRDVVQNLLLFARLDEAKFKKVDLHEGIESTIRQLTRYFSNGSIELHRAYSGLPFVDCYAGQLNQVWMNLLVNAIHAIGREGHIRISTRLENQNVLVTISDTGKGIAPEHLDKIFEPFFTTKIVGGGMGLGLSITSGIVERHNGSITVESCPGLGTTFTVRLPVNAGCSAV